MSAETVEAACIGLLNLTSEEMMAEAVTELVGSLAGQPGTKTMIDGQIYDGGWSGLLAEASIQHNDDTTDAGKALGRLMDRFDVSR